MDIAKKIRSAGLGCARPKRGAVLGGTKVTCVVRGEHVNVEVYDSPADFRAGVKIACSFGIPFTSVTDGRRWSVTANTAATNRRLRGVVGGKVVQPCRGRR
ncbi:hypothetical protein [Actinomadura fibrosa]|uniref:Uncharacterized protein n=1 Tax=Actinomadura fibrosa TaxID=111802 RepID=A0ABW2XB16_9ACTN|nr:hypothetical protein [Actinomadura fibrosa]